MRFFIGWFCRLRLRAEKCAADYFTSRELPVLSAQGQTQLPLVSRLPRLKSPRIEDLSGIIDRHAFGNGILTFFHRIITAEFHNRSVHRIALVTIILALTGQIQQLNAAPAFVQASSGGQQGASATAATGATATTAGNTLVCFARQQNNQTASIADTAGDTFVLTMQRRETGSTIYTWIVVTLIANGANVVTVTWGASIGFTYITCGEFSGLDQTGPRDVTTLNVNPADTTSGTFSTLRAAEAIVVGLQVDAIASTWTAGAGYTIPAGATSPDTVVTFEYKIVATTQSAVTATVTNTSGANLLMNIVSLTAPVGGGGGGTQTSYGTAY